jgi:hypothetical protein
MAESHNGSKTCPKTSRVISRQGYLYLLAAAGMLLAPRLVVQVLLETVSDEQADMLRTSSVGVGTIGYLFVQMGRTNSSFIMAATTSRIACLWFRRSQVDCVRISIMY